MLSDDLSDTLALILSNDEAEWIEFKCNNSRPDAIGETLSAISNASRLHDRETGYIVWGIENDTRKVVGTTFKPRKQRVKSQELENWLATQLDPRIDFKIYELQHDGSPVVIFSVQPCKDRPVSFRGREFIRVGSYTKPLRDHPEKERLLWTKASQVPFERDIAARRVRSKEVLGLLDYASFYRLPAQTEPAPYEVLKRFEKEKFILQIGPDKWDITNLGAISLANRLSDFELLERKSVRVIAYRGVDRTETNTETIGAKGYASGFAGLVKYINERLPTNEQVVEALRRQARMYPEIAIRELVANAIIHQDFHMRGVSPLVEIFSDRIEITNPGQPLISTLRFIDEPPQSRNERLARLMRRLSICEERGSGVDKVIFQAEFYQLPAPEWTTGTDHTKVAMFAHKKLSQMGKSDKIRACYQHACLQLVSNQIMTNATLRKRFSIAEQNYSIASRIIGDTIDARLIKPKDQKSTSRKHAQYIPFWA